MDNLLFENGQKNVHTFYWGEGNREGGIQMTGYLRKHNKTKQAKLTHALCFNHVACG